MFLLYSYVVFTLEDATFLSFSGQKNYTASIMHHGVGFSSTVCLQLMVMSAHI